jgi:L-asparaginase II
LIVKSGAEALLLMAFREPALGIAIKVVDGGSRALAPIAVEVLKQLKLIERIEDHPTLIRHERPRLENARQLVTGEIRPDFQLARF